MIDFTKPIILIGLGGTGIEIISKIKKRLKESYPSNNSSIRFLGIDTMSQKANSEVAKLDNTEFVNIQMSEISDYIDLSIHDLIREWWSSDYLNIRGNSMRGAGQIRPCGRLALYVKIENILKMIRSQINLAAQLENTENANNQVDIDVFIFSSVGGGTGSSMILDIAFLVRSILGKNYNGVINGILVLPSIFEDKGGTDWVSSNAYAALLEIDHFMTVLRKEKHEIVYAPEIIVPLNERPFNQLYLIDNQNSKNLTINSLADITSFAADALKLFLIPEIKTQIDESDPNIRTTYDQKPVSGKFRSYSSLGYCELIASKNTLSLREDMELNLAHIKNQLLRKDIPLGQDNPLLSFKKSSLEKKVIFDEVLGKLIELVGIPEIGSNLNGTIDEYKSYVEVEVNKKVNAANLPTNLGKWLNQKVEELEKAIVDEVEKIINNSGNINTAIDSCDSLINHLKDNEFLRFLPDSPPDFQINNSFTNNYQKVSEKNDFSENTKKEKRNVISKLFTYNRNKKNFEPDIQEIEDDSNIGYDTNYAQNFLTHKNKEEASKYSSNLFNQLRKKTDDISKNLRQIRSMIEDVEFTNQYFSNEGITRFTNNPFVGKFAVDISSLSDSEPDIFKFIEGFTRKITEDKKVISWSRKTKVEFREEFLSYIRTAVESSTSLINKTSMLDVISSYLERKDSGVELLKEKFSRAVSIAEPLISYSSSAKKIGSGSTEKSLFIILPKSLEQIESKFDISDYLPIDKQSFTIRYRTDINDRIIFFKRETGIPLFTVLYDKNWADKYWSNSHFLEPHVHNKAYLFKDSLPMYHETDSKDAEDYIKNLAKLFAYKLIEFKELADKEKMEFSFGSKDTIRIGSPFQFYWSYFCYPTWDTVLFIKDIIKVVEGGNELLETTKIKQYQDAIIEYREKRIKPNDLKIMIENYLKEFDKYKSEFRMTTPVRRLIFLVNQTLEKIANP